MKKLLPFGMLLAACCALIGYARAADDTTSETRATETRAIDARVVRVKLDGVIDLKLIQGATPSLRLVADKRYMGKITAVQTGDTLHLDTDGHGIKLNRSSVRAELVLPMLREVVSEGVGATEINGFSGDELELTLDGAGSVKLAGDYKSLKGNLGGVGSMQLWVSENDSVDLNLHGAGHITLGGRGKLLHASLSGLGSLNAQQFQADAVNVELSGLGNAIVNARNAATLNLSGLGSVTVYGKPAARNVSVDGLGKVSWK